MKIELDMPEGLESQLRNLVMKAAKEGFDIFQNQMNTKQWMNLKEAAEYAGVSYNTFIRYRNLGLKVCEIDGVKRVSKKVVDDFLESNSY